MKIRTLNDRMIPLAPKELCEWEEKKKELIANIKFASSIDLLKHDAPLDAKIFDTTEFDGFVTEKVIFQSLPGFYVTGNLYRPKDITKKYPAILNPHGHWKDGRLSVTDLSRIPQRCANFAMRGMVAFIYDMIGYVDSKQIPHRSYSPEWSKWNYGRFSLQLNNSKKALDFVSSLPYVDKDRIGCTGCSGGGTQTYFLTATDERIKVSAPINMASTVMQGGCICENIPFLRTEFCNVDYTMAAAPRPLFMSGSDGDWTVNSETVEFPAVEKIYALYNASDKYEHFYQSAPHCFNKPTRERVYKFFCKHFGVEDKFGHEVDFEIDTDLLTIKDITPYVPKKGFIRTDEQLFKLVKDIISDNLAKLSDEEKAELKKRVFVLDKHFELDIPYWFENEGGHGRSVVLGNCTTDNDSADIKYYHTYNYADDTKRVNALADLFRSMPKMNFKASGKTAALCQIASQFVPNVKLQLENVDDSGVFIPGSELVK